MKSVHFIVVVIMTGALLFKPSRTEAASADTGTAVAAGLAIAVVGAYALLALQSDAERLSENSQTDVSMEQIMARATEKADAAPIRVEPMIDATSSIHGALVAVRTSF